MKKLEKAISISSPLYTSLMFYKLNYFWSSNPYIIFTYFSLFWFSPSFLFHYYSYFPSIRTNSISIPFLPFNLLPCHYIIMTSYYIIWCHITSHCVIHLIYAIPKIYNNQPLLQYHMYPLSIPCNIMYPSFIPRNNVIYYNVLYVVFCDRLPLKST